MPNRKNLSHQIGAALVGAVLLSNGVFPSLSLAQAPVPVPVRKVVILEDLDGFEPDPYELVRRALADLLREKLAAQNRALTREETLQLWQSLSKEIFGAQPFISESNFSWLDSTALRLIAARKAYFQFQFARCLELLGEAETLEEKNPSQGHAYAPVRFQRFLLTGVCHWALFQKQEAKQAFSKALRVGENLILDPRVYSPEVIEAFDQTKDEMQNQESSAPGVAVSIDSTPPFLNVIWDGEFLGQTPLTLQKVPLTTHLLQIEGEGYASWRKKIVVDPNSKPSAMAKLIPLVSVAGKPEKSFGLVSAYPLEDPRALSELHFFGEVMGVDQLGLLRLKNQDGILQVEWVLFDVHQQVIEKKIITNFSISDAGGVEKVVQEISQPMGQGATETTQKIELFPVTAPRNFSPEDLQRVDQAAETSLPPAHESAPQAQTIEPDDLWYKRWWVWTLIAFVVAGAATGTVLAMGSGGTESGGSPGGNTLVFSPKGVGVSANRD